LNTKHGATLRVLLKQFGLFIAAAFLGPFVARASPGDLDPTFGVTGKLRVAPLQGVVLNTAFAVEPTGAYLVVGNRIFGPSFSPEIFRVLQTGSIDATYAAGNPNLGSHFMNAVVTLGDGASISGGTCYVNNSFPSGKANFCLVKRTATGELDASWGTGGILTTQISPGYNAVIAMTIQQNGYVVAAGVCRSAANDDFCVARYTGTGQLDTTFNSQGYLVLDMALGTDSLSEVALDGAKIVVSGTCNSVNVESMCIARINSDGSLDTSFNGSGKKVFVSGTGPDRSSGLAVINGGYVLLGRCTAPSGQQYCGVRLNPDGSRDGAFADSGVLVLAPAEQQNVVGSSHKATESLSSPRHAARRLNLTFAYAVTAMMA
jgi:uncharacterized delta-60 repeat protein